MSTINNANIPGGAPLVDNNGQITQVWYQFMLALFNRTGGGGVPTDITALQAAVDSQGKEIDAQAVPLPYRPVQTVSENVALRMPQQSLMNEGLVTPQTGTFRSLPSYSKVRATNTSAQSIPFNTATVVTNWTTDYDIRSNFIASTGVFTAPADGYYLVCAQLLYSASFAITENAQGMIFVSGVQKNSDIFYCAAATSFIQLKMTSVFKLSAGQTVDIRTQHTHAGGAPLSSLATGNVLSITQLP